MIFLMLSCATSDPESAPQYLSTPRLLRRMSLDVRGTLPTLSEYESVQQPNVDWDSVVDVLLDSPEYEEHLVHRFGDIWHTRVDQFDIVSDDFNLDAYVWWFPFSRTVGEEPLRLMAHIAANDLPWTEIVTSDTVLANDLLATIFPIEYLDGTSPDELSTENLSNWREARYTDGRPPVGILSTNGLWWRYPTDSFNMNRTRAAMLTKMLLCDDYLARPIDFSASDDILENTETAIKEDPSCLTCHASLDPLSSAMFGFWWVERYNPLEATYYHPERELMGMEMMGVEPSWFGQPVLGFAEVGELIAQDIRFSQCTITQALEMLYQRKTKATDFPQVSSIQETFETEYSYKSIWKAVLLSDEYRTESAGSGSNVQGYRMLSPYQMEHSLRTLTTYTWSSGGFELMDIDYRTMAGGIDGYQTFEQQYYPNLSSTVVLERLAQAHSAAAVQRGVSDFDFKVDFQHPDFYEQLSQMRLLLHGEVADDVWTGETLQLWIQVFDASNQNAEMAWEVVLGALIQDVDFVRY